MRQTITIGKPDDPGRFTIRTQSQRRYLVIDTVGKFVLLRTDDPATAEKRRRQHPTRRVVFDRVAEVYR